MNRCQTWRKTSDVVVPQNERERKGRLLLSSRCFGTESGKDRVLTAQRGVRSQPFSPGSASHNESVYEYLNESTKLDK